jgi:hypothetical protein
MIVARMFCRKRKTTRTTRMTASMKVWIHFVDRHFHEEGGVEGDLVLQAGREALRDAFHGLAHSAWAVCRALAPGWR